MALVAKCLGTTDDVSLEMVDLELDGPTLLCHVSLLRKSHLSGFFSGTNVSASTKASLYLYYPFGNGLLLCWGTRYMASVNLAWG